MKDALSKLIKAFAASIPILGALFGTLAFGCEPDAVGVATLLGLIPTIILIMAVFD